MNIKALYSTLGRQFFLSEGNSEMQGGIRHYALKWNTLKNKKLHNKNFNETCDSTTNI